MDKKCIVVEGMRRVGPFSHAVEANGMVYLSGVVPVDPRSGEPVSGDIGQAVARIINTIQEVLEAAGTGLDRIVKATVFLRDMADYKAVNEAYSAYFKSDLPARTCVAVRELPGNHPLEIEVIALAGAAKSSKERN